MRSFTIAATMVASASLALAGSATVVNNCDFDVYLWSVVDEAGPTQKLSPGKSWSEPYQTRSDNQGGCSVKISDKDDISGPVTQFEYTYTPGSAFGGIFYDISNINGDPMNNVLTQIIPQTNGNANSDCKTVNCPKGQTKCAEAYNVWNDDFATHSCPDGTNLVFNVCDPNGKKASSSDNGNSGSSSPAPAPAPQTPSPAPTTTPAPSPTPAPQQQPQTSAPAPAAPKPATPASGFALEWTGSGPVRLGKIASKREAHVNHLERHNRIRRMHHARTVA